MQDVHILVLNTSASERSDLTQVWQATGRSIVAKEVRTRDAFLEALASEPPDLVVNLCLFPELDGLAALQLAQDANLKAPFVIVGEKRGTGAEECLAAGATAFFAKGEEGQLAEFIRRLNSDQPMPSSTPQTPLCNVVLWIEPLALRLRVEKMLLKLNEVKLVPFPYNTLSPVHSPDLLLASLNELTPAIPSDWSNKPLLLLVSEEREAEAIELVRQGALGYILLEHLSEPRLHIAIHQALRQTTLQNQYIDKISTLQQTLTDLQSQLDATESALKDEKRHSDSLKQTLAEQEYIIAERTKAHEEHLLSLQQTLTDLQSQLDATESALKDEKRRSELLTKEFAEQERLIASLTKTHEELQLWYNDLQLHAKRSRELLEHSSSLILLLDADAIITEALSSAAERLLGYLRSELVGRSVFEFVFADDRAIAEVFFAQQVAAPDAIPPVKVRMVRKDGQPIHVEIASHNLLRNESVGAILLNVSDATAYAQLEQQLHTAKNDFDARLTERTHELSELTQKLQAEMQARAHLEAALQQSQDDLWKVFRLSPLAAVLCRADNGYTLNVNSAFTTLSGIAYEDALGKPIDALGIGLSAEQFHAVVSLPPESDTLKRLNFEADFHSKSGEVKNVALTLQPVQLAQEHCILIFVQDLTAHKQAEKLLKQSLTEKASVLEDIYHQVSNDLQVVSSLLYLQSLKVHDAQAREIFRESQNRVKSLALLYEQLCHTPTSSKVNFAEYLHNLASVLAESYSTSAVIEVQPSNEHLDLSIDSAVPAGLIVTELLTNSLKYAFPESWHSADALQKISIHTHQSSDGEITLTVRDNGIGLDHTQSIEAPKTLGLRLVKMLTEQLHGRLEALSEAGAIFHIRFRDKS